MCGILRHTTTDKDGKRTYRTNPKHCASCPLDLVEQLRKTERGKELYAMRKETIERVFGDAKEKHAMRYTQYRGLARVTNWVRLKFVAINLKKLATWAGGNIDFFCLLHFLHQQQ